MKLKASLLRRGEALLGNASTSPSNCVGTCVWVSACGLVALWRDGIMHYEESVFLGGVPGGGAVYA